MRRESSKSALFLMELILAVLFFAITSAVCAKLFAASHLISRDTMQANRAAALAQSAAACVQSTGADSNRCAELLSGEAAPDGTITVFYDSDWQITDQSSAVYTMTVLLDFSAEKATALVAEDEKTIFELRFGWHSPLDI